MNPRPKFTPERCQTVIVFLAGIILMEVEFYPTLRYRQPNTNKHYKINKTKTRYDFTESFEEDRCKEELILGYAGIQKRWDHQQTTGDSLDVVHHGIVPRERGRSTETRRNRDTDQRHKNHGDTNTKAQSRGFPLPRRELQQQRRNDRQ